MTKSTRPAAIYYTVADELGRSYPIVVYGGTEEQRFSRAVVERLEATYGPLNSVSHAVYSHSVEEFLDDDGAPQGAD